MFFLPSFKQALLGVAILCLIIGFLAYPVLPSHGLINVLILALPLFVLTFVADIFVSKVFLKGDPIFLSRRTLVLSLFSLGFWLPFIAIGAGLSFWFGWLIWVKLSLLGYAAILTLRIIVFIATSAAASWRRGIAALLQPTLCVVVFLAFWVGISSGVEWQFLPFIIVAPVIAFMAGLLFFYPLERLGKRTCSVSSIPLFKAFIINWVTDINEPIEKLFEDMGEDTDIEVNVLKFESSKPKAAMIVPLVHPGPFKNVGSSLLPSLLKQEFQKEFGCDTCVPLGILGHERDLASQVQNQKIVSQVLASAQFQASAGLASPLVRVTEGVATASCQIFGDAALLSFSLAPKTTEDLPQELGRIVSEEAAGYGLKHTVVVNTHNSLTDIVDTNEHLEPLRTAASKCLESAVSQSPTHFMVGSASVYPKEFSLKAGMGPGGITALVVQVERQKTAYVVIDGNNMISGLREKVLAALASAGFDQSEVFTTDTHAVSAIITGRRGYHPVGEVMDQEVLMRYIVEVAKKANSNLEVCKAGCLQLTVPQVRVIGEERLKSMTTLVDKGIQIIKKMLVPVFGLEGLILVLLLILL
jgi:putative membrane protein